MAFSVGPAERGGCPGADEYGRGLTMRVIHSGSCCEQWDAAQDAARRPGEPLWQWSARLDGEMKLAIEELDAAERMARADREAGQ